MRILSEEQYVDLCETCDHLLLASDASSERVSIQWLHVVREHPVFLKNYEDIYFPVYFRILTKYVRKIRNWIHLFYSFLKNWKNESKLWHESDILPNQTDILFISHLTNVDHAGKKEDFYFSKLPEQLHESGCSVVIALLNHSNYPAESIASIWAQSAIKYLPRVIFSKFIGFSKEKNIFKRLKLESNRLIKQASLEKPQLVKKVLSRASDEALSPESRMILRLSEQMGALVSQIQPKVVIITHEGHAWERGVFHAIWKANPDILRIGYQHAAMFRLQHAIRRKLAKQFNPDQILASGQISKGQLENSQGLNGIPISLLGSYRYVKPMARNYNEIFKLNTCLVIPEGIVEECNILFEFSLDCALRLPDTKFIWRLHPQIDFKQIDNNNGRFNNLPANIIISEHNLEDDILQSSCVLYRGSSVVIQSVVYGLKPLYVRIKGEMIIDPLYEVNKGREIIESVDEFVQIFNIKQDRKIVKSLTEYCNKLYSPLNLSIIKDGILDCI